MEMLNAFSTTIHVPNIATGEQLLEALEVRMREEAEEKQPVVLIRMFGALQVSANVTLEGTSLLLQLKLPLPFLR